MYFLLNFSRTGLQSTRINPKLQFQQHPDRIQRQMSGQHAQIPQMFGVTKLSYGPDNPIHVTQIGNIVYAANSAESPSLWSPTITSMDNKIDELERGLKHLKYTAEKKTKEIWPRKKSGQELSTQDEEWIDDGGNLINEKLLIDNILSLGPSVPSRLSCDQFNTIIQLAEAYTTSGVICQKEASTISKKQKIDAAKSAPATSTHISPKTEPNKQKPTQSVSNQICLATHSNKLEVLAWHHKNGGVQTKMCAHFAIAKPELLLKQPLLSK